MGQSWESITILFRTSWSRQMCFPALKFKMQKCQKEKKVRSQKKPYFSSLEVCGLFIQTKSKLTFLRTKTFYKISKSILLEKHGLSAATDSGISDSDSIWRRPKENISRSMQFKWLGRFDRLQEWNSDGYFWSFGKVGW